MATEVMILFAHGARDPEWARPVEAVAAKLRDAFPDKRIEIAFLEFMQPTLSEAVARVIEVGLLTEAANIHILPFFIAQGGHLRKELPVMLAELREQHPEHSFHMLPPLGELPVVQAAMAEAIAGLFLEALRSA